MLQGLSNAIKSYFDAFKYVRTLWRWQIGPGVISLILGVIIFGLAYEFGDNLGRIMSSWYPWDFGKSAINWFFMMMGKIMLFITGLFAYRYILLIVISPMLSILSEKVEQLYMDNPDHQMPGFSVRKLARDVSRGIRLTIRNLIRELSYTIALFLLGFIPGASVFTTPLTFGVQSYYAGFANMDFTMERYMNVKERIQFVKNNKGMAIGNGIIFLLLLMIPVLGLLLAPTLGVIAATLDVTRASNTG